MTNEEIVEFVLWCWRVVTWNGMDKKELPYMNWLLHKTYQEYDRLDSERWLTENTGFTKE